MNFRLIVLNVTVSTLHRDTIVINMDNTVADVLLAVHALTGCDTTSKAGTKSATFQAAMKCGYELLYSFGKSQISDQMILLAEKFLLECISINSERNNFDDVRFEKRTFKNRFN